MVGVKSSSSDVVVNSDPYTQFAYDLPTVTLLTPSSNAAKSGKAQLVVHGTNFGTDASFIDITLSDEKGFWAALCPIQNILVPHKIIICTYPEYDSLTGNGQSIDVNVSIRGLSIVDYGGFAYYDDTGYYSVIYDLELVINASTPRALSFARLPSSRYWSRHMQSFEGSRYIINQRFLREFLTAEEQAAVASGVSADIDSTITVYASGVLYVTSWEPVDAEALARASLNGTALVRLNVTCAVTVDGLTNVMSLSRIFS